MAGFNTKAFDTQDAIVAALRDDPGLADWQIDFGIPAGRPQEQHIWVDESVDEWTQENATTGIVARNEGFQLAIYIYDKRTGATAEEVRDEVKGAAATISDVIGSAPFLGGIVLFAQIIGATYEGAFADPEGRSREGVLKLTIGCQAFISA